MTKESKKYHLEVPETESLQIKWVASGEEIKQESVARWCAYTGQSEVAIRNWGWIEAVHPDERMQAKLHWMQGVINKKIYEARYKIYYQKGEYHTFRIKCVPIIGQQGEVQEWICWLTEDGASMPDTGPADKQINEVYTILFEQAITGMICFSLDGQLLKTNEQFYIITGHTGEQFLKSPALFFHTMNNQNATSDFLYEMLVENRQTSIREKRYTRQDGTEIWIKVSTKLLQNSLKEPLFFLSQIEDITIQKRAEEEQIILLAREQIARVTAQQAQKKNVELINQLKAIFGAMTEHVVVYDHEGKILQINTAAQNLFAQTNETNVIGKSYCQLLQHYEFLDEQRQPFDRDMLPFSRILQGAVFSYLTAIGVIVRDATGNELRLNISGAPVHDKKGNIIGGVCIFYNITEQYQKELRAQQALNILLSLVELLVRTPEHISSKSAEHEYPPFFDIAGIGQHIADLINNNFLSQVVAIITLSTEKRVPQLIGISGLTSTEQQQAREETNHSTTLKDYFSEAGINQLRENKTLMRNLKQHSMIQFSQFGVQSILITPMFIRQQMMGLFIVGKTDAADTYTKEEISLIQAAGKITTLLIEHVRILNEWAATHASQLALQEANHRFDEFMSIASHELRTPLTTIKGNVQLALKRLEALNREIHDLPEISLHHLVRIKHPLEYAIHRVSVQDRMISDLLDASRVRSNKFEIRMHPCNLLEIVRNTVEDIRMQNPDRVIDIKLPERESIPILADADRIGQVIFNYIGNALKYSASTHQVKVWLEVDNETVQVAVKDEGPGLTPAEQARIWERFYRAKGVQVEYGSGAGLGLGLYLCRIIIEQHQGLVGLESAEGQGSTFWFTLPLRNKNDLQIEDD